MKPFDLWTRGLIALSVPRSMREEFAGDLEEEARDVCGGHQRLARRFARRQVLRSIPGLLRCRVFRGGAGARERWLAAGTYAAIASLQAWDSHTFAAPPLIIGLVLAAIALLAASLLLETSAQAFGLVLCASAALVVLGRVLSPIGHNELFLVVWMGALLYFFLVLRERARASSQAADDQTPSTT